MATTLLKTGTYDHGLHNHLLDVGGLGVAHRSFCDPGQGVCTGFTVIQTAPVLLTRRAAGLHVLNGAGELTGSHQIREWGFLETPIVLTHTPGIGRAYDAVSQWMMRQDSRIGESAGVVIPVIGECDDSVLNDPRARPWGEPELSEALDEALQVARGQGLKKDSLAQGGVGAGTGMVCFDLKAGIGSASRVVEVPRAKEDSSTRYTVGVLLQTNFGLRQQLTVLGRPIGKLLKHPLPRIHREGSCIGILATDAPLGPLGLQRLATRMGLGLARTGGHAHHGSGEIFVAFSTNPDAKAFLDWETESWNPLFCAAIEATEEAVYQSLLHARPVENIRATVGALMEQELSELLASSKA